MRKEPERRVVPGDTGSIERREGDPSYGALKDYLDGHGPGTPRFMAAVDLININKERAKSKVLFDLGQTDKMFTSQVKSIIWGIIIKNKKLNDINGKYREALSDFGKVLVVYKNGMKKTSNPADDRLKVFTKLEMDFDEIVTEMR